MIAASATLFYHSAKAASAKANASSRLVEAHRLAFGPELGKRRPFNHSALRFIRPIHSAHRLPIAHRSWPALLSRHSRSPRYPAGYANPAQVRALVRQVKAAVGEENLSGLHLHNTRGLGLANVLAGLEVGITTFDSSLGGLGGCPI